MIEERHEFCSETTGVCVCVCVCVGGGGGGGGIIGSITTVELSMHSE